ncbi:hypothetical protein NNO_0794 [Hydrogenimonas sp.]|nr:hypothetical protein NNO_0794 [Hydrogenimonas sp.]
MRFCSHLKQTIFEWLGVRLSKLRPGHLYEFKDMQHLS